LIFAGATVPLQIKNVPRGTHAFADKKGDLLLNRDLAVAVQARGKTHPALDSIHFEQTLDGECQS
jgi:hypothetical protein